MSQQENPLQAKVCLECATPLALRAGIAGLTFPLGEVLLRVRDARQRPWLDAIQETRRFSSSPRGLAMYRHEKAGTALFRRITEQFPRGQIAFDGYSGKMVHPQLRS